MHHLVVCPAHLVLLALGCDELGGHGVELAQDEAAAGAQQRQHHACSRLDTKA